MANPYNPFVDYNDDEDLSLLFSGEEKREEKPEEKEVKAKTVGEIIDSLDESVRAPLKDAFSSLAGEIENLSKKSGNLDQNQLIQALQAVQNRRETPRQDQKDLAQEAEAEVKTLLRELGLEDETKATKFVKAIDMLSERKARTLYDPYVKAVSERYAKEERAAIANKYPPKDKDGKDTGYPTLEQSAQAVSAVLDRFPNMDLLEAYEWAHRDKIFGARQEVKKEQVDTSRSSGLTANDILRKLSISTDKPTTSTQEGVKNNGQAKTIREAMAMAAKELGVG